MPQYLGGENTKTKSACNCLTGAARQDAQGHCYCDPNATPGHVIVGVNDLPALGIQQMPVHPVNIHWPRGNRLNNLPNPCAGHQAPSGYQYIYQNGNCVEADVFGNVVNQGTPALNAGVDASSAAGAVASAASSATTTAAGIGTTISNFIAQNQTMVLLVVGLVAYEKFFKKGR